MLHLCEGPELRTFFWEDWEEKKDQHPAGFGPTTSRVFGQSWTNFWLRTLSFQFFPYRSLQTSHKPASRRRSRWPRRTWGCWRWRLRPRPEVGTWQVDASRLRHRWWPSCSPTGCALRCTCMKDTLLGRLPQYIGRGRGRWARLLLQVQCNTLVLVISTSR